MREDARVANLTKQVVLDRANRIEGSSQATAFMVGEKREEEEEVYLCVYLHVAS